MKMIGLILVFAIVVVRLVESMREYESRLRRENCAQSCVFFYNWDSICICLTRLPNSQFLNSQLL